MPGNHGKWSDYINEKLKERRDLILVAGMTKSQRKKLINLFKKNKIQFGFHYPKSINQIDSLKKLYKNKNYKNSELLANKCFSLPIDPMLNKNELIKIVKVLNSF